MALAASVQASCDNDLTTVLGVLAAHQEAYLAAHGRYFQGILTPSATPADGVAATPIWTVKPDYQAETWHDFAVLPMAVTHCQLRVDQYDGPQGRGWTLTGIVTSGGVAYCRTIAVGPETYRAAAWAPMP